MIIEMSCQIKDIADIYNVKDSKEQTIKHSKYLNQLTNNASLKFKKKIFPFTLLNSLTLLQELYN